MKLLIGNRNYSSWSLRAWLVLTPFRHPVRGRSGAARAGEGWQETLAPRSPTGKVPVLIDGDLVVPETIAIIEYLAELLSRTRRSGRPTGERGRWRGRRSAEMHGGFAALRDGARR